MSLASIVKAQTAPASASSSVILSAGPEGGFSAGSFKHAHKYKLSGSVQADIPVANSLYVTGNIACQNFPDAEMAQLIEAQRLISICYL